MARTKQRASQQSALARAPSHANANAKAKKRKLQRQRKHDSSGTDDNNTSKKRRWRSGTVALREIRKMQKTTDLLLPRAPIKRIIDEITADVAGVHYRYQEQARTALHEAAEIFLTDIFQKSVPFTILREKQTLQSKDFRLATENTPVKIALAIDLQNEFAKIDKREADKQAGSRSEAKDTKQENEEEMEDNEGEQDTVLPPSVVVSDIDTK